MGRHAHGACRLAHGGAAPLGSAAPRSRVAASICAFARRCAAQHCAAGPSPSYPARATFTECSHEFTAFGPRPACLPPGHMRPGGVHDRGSADRDRHHLLGLRDRLVHPRRVGGEPHRRVGPEAGRGGRAALGRAAQPDRALGVGGGAADVVEELPATSPAGAGWPRGEDGGRPRAGAAVLRAARRRPGPRPAAQGSALVRHLRRRLRRRRTGSATRTTTAPDGRLVRVPVRGGALRRLRAQGGRGADAAGGRPRARASPRPRLAPGARRRSSVRYRSRGLGDWTYAFTPGGVAQVRDFAARHAHRLRRHRLPRRHPVPHRARRASGDGWKLGWRFASLVTGPAHRAWTPPNRLNPGPLAARITFFAPVSLLFFFTVMVDPGRAPRARPSIP